MALYANPRRRGRLPGLLDQEAAARERVWYVDQVRHAALRHYRTRLPPPVDLRRYAVTVVPPRWSVPVDRFDARDVATRLIPKWRKQAQRWLRRLPPGSFALAMIEVGLNHDVKYNVTVWCFHLHLLVHLRSENEGKRREVIRKTFAFWPNERLGIPRGRHARCISRAKGGTRGWLRYSSKGLQLHAVVARYVPYNWETGRRGHARKRQMNPRELTPIAELYSHLQPDDLMVWSGHQRRGEIVVKKEKYR